MRHHQPHYNTLRQIYRSPQRVNSLVHLVIFSRRLILRTHRFAYVEFAEPEFIDPALALDNSLFHGRLIKVCLDSCMRMTGLVLR